MENTAIIALNRSDIVKANIINNRIGNGYLLAQGNELRKRMQSSVVEFWFTKKDGSVRHAFGTTMPSLTKAHINGNGCSSIKVITFFDVEKGAWRSCQIQSLLNMEMASYILSVLRTDLMVVFS